MEIQVTKLEIGDKVSHNGSRWIVRDVCRDNWRLMVINEITRAPKHLRANQVKLVEQAK